MRFQVEREALADAVAWTARSLPSRPPVPVLAGVLLDLAGEDLTVSGFDYEVSTEVTVPVQTDGPGSGGRTLVSGRLLAEITKSLPAHPVRLSVDGPRAEIVCGPSRFTLPVLPVEDYPSLPAMPAVAGAIESALFATAVGQVAIAAGRDETLPVLTGVRLEFSGEQVTMAATDRYRLAIREIPWRPATPGFTATALVPARTLLETARNLAAGPEVTLALTASLEEGSVAEGLMGFSGGGRRTTTRLLDGEFPKYRSLLPADFAAVALVSVAALIESVKRVALVAERNTPVRLRFDEGGVVLEAGGAEEAQASETLKTDYEGEPMTVAFNPQYLLDGLGALDSDTARLAFTAPSKPAVLTGKEGGTDYQYLLMPVRLSG